MTTLQEDKIFQLYATEFPFDIDMEGLEAFIHSFQRKTYPKGTLIMQADARDKQLRFLDKGIVREYYAIDGREKNIHFYTKAELITDFSSFISDQPTKKNQDCLTDVELRVLSREQFLIFQNTYPCGKEFIDTVFQRLLACKEQREFANFVKTTEELYLDILENQADWLQLVPQYHIASYLGVTPETLSRIRRRI